MIFRRSLVVSSNVQDGNRSAILFLLLLLSCFASQGFAQDKTLSTKISSVAPESCLSWAQWSNPYQADANSANAVDRMLAEADISRFCRDLTDKLGKLAGVLVPEDAPAALKSAAEILGPQVVDALLRKQGCFFIEPFELGDDQMPKKLKFGALIEIGADASKSLQVVGELLRTLRAPMEVVDQGGLSVIRVALPPKGPVREIGITQQDGYLIVASSMEAIAEIHGRMDAGKQPDWLAELQSKRKCQRVASVGSVDLAMLKSIFLAAMDEEAIRTMDALGFGNVRKFEFTSGYDVADFAQHVTLTFDGKPGGIFNGFGDQGLSEADIAHFPEDSFFALTMSVDGKKALKQLQDTLVQLDPSTARKVASALIEVQGNTGIDLREVIEGLGPSFSIHNGFGDGILSGVMLKATIKDPATFENALTDAMRLMQGRTGEFKLGMDSFELNGKSVNTMRFGGAPVPVEPSWFFEGDQMTLSLFPSVLSSATNPDSVPLLVKSKSFAPYLPLMQGGSEGKVVGFSYSETKLSYELLHGYVCLFKAMGKNVLGGEYNPQLVSGLSPEQFEGLQELFKDLQLPSCRSVVKHMTPQVAVLRMEQDAIAFESHSSMMSSNVTMVVPGIAVGMLLPAVQAVRAAARRTQSLNNLRQLSLASLNYESAHQHFPSGDGPVKEGGPAVSWRVKILPYIEHQDLYEQYNFDEPWDSEGNRRLVEQMPETFKNPASAAQAGHTVYRGIGGEVGVMGVDRAGNSVKRGFADITDGSSNTILFIETPDNAAVPWTQPDGGINPGNVAPWDLIGNHPGGFNVCFCDGSTHFLSNSITEELLRNLMSMRDGNVVGGY